MRVFNILFLMIYIAFISKSYGDYGSTALDITCDAESGYFKIEPKILWNEEYENFLSANPNGVEESGKKSVYLMEKVIPLKFNESCVLGDRIISIESGKGENDPIIIKENDKEIINKLPRWVWGAYGPLYMLESKSKSNWSECCGHVDFGMACRSPQQKETTECTKEEVETLKNILKQ